MPMQMGWRWYGEGNDPITLSDIKQIPGVTSIVWALHHKMPGEIWEENEIKEVMDQIHAYGFNGDVVESVNVHDDIKIGLPTRDKYIENYKQCIRNLSKFGVKVICYNFMPIFDWTRTDLFHPIGDGSTALFYQKDMIKDDYKAMAKYIMDFTEKYNMTFPGWEPERMAKLDELFKAYAPVTKEKLWENLKYFLEALMPTCRECDIKMAIHMDDPPWDIFGLPRLLVDAESIDRFLSMVDDPYNCLTLCSGSLNANPNNNVAAIVRKHCDRIPFAHIRNIHHFENGDFSEAAHRDCCGETGIIEILRAYHDCGFEGCIRPDHGRQLWEEGPGNCRPGYGKYDRPVHAGCLGSARPPGRGEEGLIFVPSLQRRNRRNSTQKSKAWADGPCLAFFIESSFCSFSFKKRNKNQPLYSSVYPLDGDFAGENVGVTGFIVDDEAPLLVNIFGDTGAAVIGYAASQVDALCLVLVPVRGKALFLISIQGAVKPKVRHILGQPFGVRFQVNVHALQCQAGTVGQACIVKIFLWLGQVDANAYHQAVPVRCDLAQDTHDLFAVQQQIVGPLDLAVDAIALL